MSMLDETRALDQYYSNKEYYDALDKINERYKEYINSEQGHKESFKNMIDDYKENINDIMKGKDKYRCKRFNPGDIVIYTRGNESIWKRGVVMGDNFDKQPYEDEYLGYYVKSFNDKYRAYGYPENEFILDESVKDYITIWHDDYSWMLGKKTSEVPLPCHQTITPQPENDYSSEIDDQKKHMFPYDMILVNELEYWRPDFFAYYIDEERTGIMTMSQTEIKDYDKWVPVCDNDEYSNYKRMLNLNKDYALIMSKNNDVHQEKNNDMEQKLDLVIDKLNHLLNQLSTDNYTYPNLIYTEPLRPMPVMCNNNYTTTTTTSTI